MGSPERQRPPNAAYLCNHTPEEARSSAHPALTAACARRHLASPPSEAPATKCANGPGETTCRCVGGSPVSTPARAASLSRSSSLKNRRLAARCNGHRVLRGCSRGYSAGGDAKFPSNPSPLRCLEPDMPLNIMPADERGLTCSVKPKARVTRVLTDLTTTWEARRS